MIIWDKLFGSFAPESEAENDPVIYGLVKPINSINPLVTFFHGFWRLVHRTYYSTIPPKVEYKLTQMGESFKEPVSAIGNWALNNLARIYQE